VTKKIFWIITIVTAGLSLLLFFLPYISPAQLPISAYAFILIPVVVFVNIILLLLWTCFRPYKALLPLLILFFAFPYLTRTVAIHPGQEEGGDFKVLSYNVRVFNVYSHLQDEQQKSSRKMIDWIINNDAAIKCFQEFYNNDTAKIFCSIKKIKEKMPYYYFTPFHVDNGNGSYGMALFSRYPIIRKGIIRFKEKSNNQVIYADIKLGKDTLRIFNMHLQSLNITEKNIIEARLEELDKDDLKILLKIIKEAAVKRSRQIELVDNYIKESPYKVIICGDLNDTPYSYCYQKLSGQLNNAFEKAGNGLGFTYRSKAPLRIDNEFADKRFVIKDFKVYNNISYSDHYPIEASFSIKN